MKTKKKKNISTQQWQSLDDAFLGCGCRCSSSHRVVFVVRLGFDVFERLAAHIVLPLGVAVVRLEFEKLLKDGLHLLGRQLQRDAPFQHLTVTRQRKKKKIQHEKRRMKKKKKTGQISSADGSWAIS